MGNGRGIVMRVEVQPLTVAEAGEMYIRHRKARKVRFTYSTEKRYDLVLRRLAEAAGPDLYVHEVKGHHIDEMLMGFQDVKSGTRNQLITCLNTFFEWCEHRGHSIPARNPMVDYDRAPVEDTVMFWLPGHEFGRLLDTMGQVSPVRRAYGALGLGLMGRGPSEIAPIRMWQVDLQQWCIRLGRKKVGREDPYDDFRIMSNVRAELVRYLEWYRDWSLRTRGHDLLSNDYLLPHTRYSSRGKSGPIRPEWFTYHPGKQNGRLRIWVRDAMIQMGYEEAVRDMETGRYNRAGGSHLLRRSGARDWFLYLVENRGFDGALRMVQSALGHKYQSTTEHYLGLDLDRTLRNRLLTEYQWPTNEAAPEMPELPEQERETLGAKILQFPKWERVA